MRHRTRSLGSSELAASVVERCSCCTSLLYICLGAGREAPRLARSMPSCGGAWSMSTSSRKPGVGGSSCRPCSPRSWRNTGPRMLASARSPARCGKTAGWMCAQPNGRRSTKRWTARNGNGCSTTPRSGPLGCTTRATPPRPCHLHGVPEQAAMEVVGWSHRSIAKRYQHVTARLDGLLWSGA